jgi:small-conductance mechanosensitive channel
VPVGVSFGSDTRKVERVLREIAEEQPMAILNPPPMIVLTGFGADAINFEIRVILRDVNFNLSVRTEINHRIVERFAEENIEIPFAQTEVSLRNVDALGRALAELRGPPDLRAELLSPSRPPSPEVP